MPPKRKGSGSCTPKRGTQSSSTPNKKGTSTAKKGAKASTVKKEARPVRASAGTQKGSSASAKNTTDRKRKNAKRESDAEEEQWSCLHCTLLNPVTRKTCCECRKRKGTTPKYLTTLETGTSTQPVVSSGVPATECNEERPSQPTDASTGNPLTNGSPHYSLPLQESSHLSSSPPQPSSFPPVKNEERISSAEDTPASGPMDTEQREPPSRQQLPGTAVSTLFQTGKGGCVTVSAASLVAAKQKYCNDDEEPAVPGKPSGESHSIVSSLFETARGRKVCISASKLEEAKRHLAAEDEDREPEDAGKPQAQRQSEPQTSMVTSSLFETARGRKVCISTTKLEEAKRHLAAEEDNEPEEEPNEVKAHEPQQGQRQKPTVTSSLFETAAGQRVSISSKKLEEARAKIEAIDEAITEEQEMDEGEAKASTTVASTKEAEDDVGMSELSKIGQKRGATVGVARPTPFRRPFRPPMVSSKAGGGLLHGSAAAKPLYGVSKRSSVGTMAGSSTGKKFVPPKQSADQDTFAAQRQHEVQRALPPVPPTSTRLPEQKILEAISLSRVLGTEIDMAAVFPHLAAAMEDTKPSTPEECGRFEFAFHHFLPVSLQKADHLSSVSSKLRSLFFSTGNPNGVGNGEGDECPPSDPELSGRHYSFGFFRLVMLRLGCAENFVTERWVAHHYKWILWKVVGLVAFSRSAAVPNQEPCALFNPLAVLDQLIWRYNKEYVSGQRSCIRQITEGDTSAKATMVLFVSGLLYPDGSATNSGGSSLPTGLRLSDGWYELCVTVDVPLQSMIRDRQFVFGQKLILCGASFSSNGSGYHPLDVPSSATLAIHYNGCQLAAPTARLGFTASMEVPVLPLESVHPAGGSIPSVVGTVVKVLPTCYWDEEALSATSDGEHQQHSNSSGRPTAKRILRNQLSFDKALEARQRSLEHRHFDDSEGIADGKPSTATGWGTANGWGSAFNGREASRYGTILMQCTSSDELFIIKVWNEGDSGLLNLTLGATYRIYNLSPSKSGQQPPPFPPAKLLNANGVLQCFRLDVVPTTSAAATGTSSSPMGTLTALGGYDEVTPNCFSDLVCSVVGIYENKEKPGLRRLAVRDQTRNCFGIVFCREVDGYRRLAFPSFSVGDVLFISNVTFEGFDNHRAMYNHARFHCCEYTQFLRRSKRPDVEQLLVDLKGFGSQQPPAEATEFVEGYLAKAPEYMDASSSARLHLLPTVDTFEGNSNLENGKRQSLKTQQPLSATLEQSKGALFAPPPSSVTTTVANAQPRRTLISQSFSTVVTGDNGPVQGPTPTRTLFGSNGNSGISASPLGNASAHPHLPPIPASRGQLVSTEQQTSTPPPLPSVGEKIYHWYGNFLPEDASITVLAPVKDPRTETSAIRPFHFTLLGATMGSVLEASGAIDMALYSEAAAEQVEVHPTIRLDRGGKEEGSERERPTLVAVDPSLFEYFFDGAASFARLSALCSVDHASELHFLRSQAVPCEREVTVCTGASVGTTTSSTGMSSTAPPPKHPEMWSQLFVQSVVIPEDIWHQAQGDNDLPMFLQTLKRWNTNFVKYEDVLWWHADEWKELQWLFAKSVRHRLFKVTLVQESSSLHESSGAPSLSVQKLYPLCTNVPARSLFQ